MAAQAGVWRTGSRLQAAEWVNCPVPSPEAAQGRDAFGVLVRRPGAELIFLEGSILICRPLAIAANALPEGTRVVVRCDKPGKVEITVRELRRHSEEPRLWSRSGHPEHDDAHPLDTSAARPGKRSWPGAISVIGIVVASSWRPETARPGK
jgi:hypothetical protein